MDIALVLVAVVTALAGAAAGWALARARTTAGQAAVTTERDTARAEVAAARAEVSQLRAERDDYAGRLRASEAAATEATARLDSERRAATEKLALLDEAKSQLRDTLNATAQEALRKNNEQFLDLADTKFKEAGAPLTETLGKVELQLRQIEKERTGAQQALAQQIEFVRRTGEDLRTETAALVSALRKPQTRGRWGELQLRSCVEYAGMTERCDFVEQQTVTTGDGAQRPDLVIKLVGGKSIVVDSKVTLAAYLEAHDATDDAVREERLTAHARHLRNHVDQLSTKAYWSQFSASPEFVVLFVPGEAFLAPALDRDPTLLEDAFAKRVHIATPTTLVSVLRTCSYAWQQEALAANAREVFDLGRELYQRIGKLGTKVETLGRRLGSAVGAYNETVASLESRVLPQARKLKELKVVDAELDAPRPIEEAIRPVAAAELVAAVDEARPVVALQIESAGLAEREVELDRPADYGLLPPQPTIGESAAG
jgi:DNA anti-recombination protein RmuC